jgi:hypothetical protein
MALIYSYPLAEEVTSGSWVLGSEMDNGTRVVKNYSVGDLVSFTRGFVTLNDVLDNNNVSLLDAYVGQVNLFDSDEDDYGSLQLNSNVFEVAAASGTTILNIDNCYLTMYQNGDGHSATIFFTGATDRNYELPDANGTIALTDDLLDYVPYTGATQSIDLGNYDIFTAGNARLGDDGTVWGSSFQFGGFFNSSLQAAVSAQRAWVLPDESGVIALTKYKVYTAILTQTGTSAPVATVLENTLGATITWSYVGVGQYYATASSAVFTAGKTTGILSNSSSTGINAFVNISTTVFNTVTTSSGVAANNELVKNMVEIRVYN